MNANPSGAPDQFAHNDDPQKQEDTQSHNEAQDNGPPPKRRKLADSATRQSSTPRPISPPWKKIAVEGPTSFIEGGRRKSSRTNFVPLELQPQADKRQTRATVQHTQATKGKHHVLATSKPSPLTSSTNQPTTNGKRPSSSGRSTSIPAIKSPSKATQTNGYGPTQQTTHVTPQKRSHKKKVPALPVTALPTTKSPLGRRAGRGADVGTSDRKTELLAMNGWRHTQNDANMGHNGVVVIEDNKETPVGPQTKKQRLNLKVRMPTVTISHPEHVPTRRRYASFEDWFHQDESATGDGIPRMTNEDATDEANLIKRVLSAGQPGGLLSAESCSRYLPDRQDELPQQYAHQDYMVAAIIDFQRRLVRERHEHEKAAKRLVYAALTAWQQREARLGRQVQKSVAEIELELKEACLAYYRLNVCGSLKLMWERVATGIDNRRHERWREEQQRLGRENLNRVLKKSTRMLHKRSGAASDDASEDEPSAGPGSDVEDSSSCLAESEDDEMLTVEELRQKYAKLPSLDGSSSSSSRSDDEKEYEDMEQEPVDVDPGGHGDAQAGYSNVNTTAVRDGASPGSIQLDDLQHTSVDDQADRHLMEDSDASTNMDDDMGDSDEGSVDDGSDVEEATDESGGSEAGAPEEAGLLGFFPRGALTKKGTSPDDMDIDQPNMRNAIEDDKTDDTPGQVRFVPDATQVQTPSATNSEEPVSDYAKVQDGEALNGYHRIEEPEIPLIIFANSPSSRSNPAQRPPLQVATEDAQVDNQQVSLPSTPVSTTTTRTPVPALLRGTLREYQHVGLDWLAKLYGDQTNGILADEMGLGKTIQTIALLAHLAVEHETWGPHLIVVPTSVMLNWEMEFKKFLPGFKVLTYYGTIEERRRKREGWMNDDKWNVWITSYALVVQDNQIFRRRDWHYMVLDEAHNIKNFRSQRWQTLLNFKTRARLLLTGTPLQNNLTELWSLLFFLMPTDGSERSIGGFAGLQEFSEWFRKPVEQILEHGKETMDEEGQAIVRQLHHTLRPYLLRRLKADVEKQMPGKYEHIVYCRLSKRQRELYQGFLNRAETKAIYASGNHLSMMNCIMQLRKVCCHPDLFETRQIVTSFAMSRSAVADFEIKDLLVRRRLLREDHNKTVDLGFINLLPGANESFSALDTIQKQRLGALGTFRQLYAQQWGRITQNLHFDGTSAKSTLANMENVAKRARFEALRHASYHTMLRSQRRPLYSYGLVSRLSLGLDTYPLPPPPMRKAQLTEHSLSTSASLTDMIVTLPRRTEVLEDMIRKFVCMTPKVVATDMLSLAIPSQALNGLRPSPQSSPRDAYHEARMRLSIAFPDKRLLQYDCGKLQRLDALLRKLQAGGHRALIFTQMTKVLDVLEQFLNIHGHRYLRLDGGTKIEQRQILTERFNNDEKIPVFILSTRSGGLGINLTGADSVIFYDSDWNPAMDKQCQDRSHRIGQTRDVHIYRLVSESTVEVNIMRRARQKTRLDEVVIQEGQFTTDRFQDVTSAEVSAGVPDDGDMETNAALDRVLGGRSMAKVFDQVEDKEDVAAARIAEKEMLQTDAADFDEKADLGAMTPKTPGPQTPGELMPASSIHAPPVERITTLDAATSGLAAPEGGFGPVEDHEVGHIDDYMLRLIDWELKDVPLQPDPETIKKMKKKGEEHRVKKRAR